MLRRGRRWQRGPLLLRWRRNDGAGARLGLAIAKRQVPTAVARNRIKRLAREAFRRQRADLPSVDLVILVRRGAGGAVCDREFALALDAVWAELSQQCAS